MMITLRAPTGFFQLRAAAICRRGDRVLIHRAIGADIWSLPGGRVDLGESSTTTIVREMAEELHTTAVIQRLVATIELTDIGRDGQAFHEVAFYYAVNLPDLVLVDAPFIGPETSNPVEFFWCPLNRLSEYTLVPSSIRPFIHATPANYTHIVVQQADYAVLNEYSIPAAS